MEQDIIIGTFITIAVAVIITIKVILHRIIKFKIDESEILTFFENSGDDYKFHSTEAISASTHITTERVTSLCSKSKSINRNPNEKQSWYLK